MHAIPAPETGVAGVRGEDWFVPHRKMYSLSMNKRLAAFKFESGMKN